MPRHTRALPVILLFTATALAADPPAVAPYTPPLLPPEIKFPSDKIVKITDTGAIADGTTLASDAIAKAIDQVSAAGGGIVEFPAKASTATGPANPAAPAATAPATVYLTGPIHLKSNITLQIDEGVTVKFSTDHKLYPLVKTRYESVDIMNFSPLIYAYQCENIRIMGKGTLDGQGRAWWTWAQQNRAGTQIMPRYTNDRTGQYPLEQRIFGDTNPGYRTCFIEPYECKNVLIEGVTLHASPFWNIHPLYSTNVTVRGVTVYGDGGGNTDGCDPDSSKTVLIEKCTFNTGDDCIAIKSGRDGDGIRKNATCENITIRDCIMKGGHGAVTMGSETSAGIKHVFSENCQVDGPDSAIRLKSMRGRGGGIEDVFIKKMTVTRTLKYAITVNMKYNPAPDAPFGETTPVFKNIRIEDFTCDNAPQAIEVVGIPESVVDGLILKNITIKATQGAHLEYLKNFTRENVNITAQRGQAWDIGAEVKENVLAPNTKPAMTPGN